MRDAGEPVQVDFRHFPHIGSMRSDLHKPRVPEHLEMDQLEQEPSFLRVFHESGNNGGKTMADNFDGATRIQMATGIFDVNRAAQTDAAVALIPFAQDDLWFTEDPANVEEEMVRNKAMVKEFVKTSGVFTPHDLYLILQSRKARRKPIEGKLRSVAVFSTIDRLIDWLIGPVIVWLIDWFYDCLFDWLLDWLIDWLIGCDSENSDFFLENFFCCCFKCDWE